MMSAMDAVRTIELPRINSPTGSITPVAGGDQVPFEIRRIYFLYDIVSGAHRGGHAHWELEQVYVAVMGAFRVVLDDGRERRTVELNQPAIGLFLPKLIWRELVDFASGTICLVLASLPYDEAEYIRSYDDFLEVATR